VVIENFTTWALLPMLLEALQHARDACDLREQFLTFLYLLNPLPTDEQLRNPSGGGFDVSDQIGGLPMQDLNLFLAPSRLWHAPCASSGSLSGLIRSFLAANSRFSRPISTMLRGALELERDWVTCGGFVLRAVRKG